jgi:hypothetical protein
MDMTNYFFCKTVKPLEIVFCDIDSRTLFGTVYGGGAPSKCFMINDGGNIVGCTRANVLCEKSLILDGRM